MLPITALQACLCSFQSREVRSVRAARSGRRIYFSQLQMPDETLSLCAALATMMLEGLLNAGHEAVRASAFRFGERLCQTGGGQGHLHLLDMLRDLDLADQHPHTCLEYYRLLIAAVRTIPQTPPQACFESSPNETSYVPSRFNGKSDALSGLYLRG